MSGGPVWVAGRELAVADVRWDHELLGHHHVHRDEVALQRLDAVFSVLMRVAPVVLEVEQCLRLKDGVFQVRLDPFHTGNALVTGKRSLLGMASPHGRAHVPRSLVARDEPVNNSTKHIRIVLSEMARAALLVLLLYGGAVVDRKIVSEYVRVAVDDAPESLHLHDTLSTSEAVILAKDNSNDKGRENSSREHLQSHWKSDLR